MAYDRFMLMQDLKTFFWGSLIQPAVNLVKQDRTLSYLREIERLPGMSPEDIAGFQMNCLKRLIRHCYDHVPYYRELFDGLSLSPDDIGSLRDYSRLPILTRDVVVARNEDFIARNFRREALIPKSTGGSTGTPLNIYYDRQYYERGEAGMLRMFGVAGYNLGEPYVLLWSYPSSLKDTAPWKQNLRQMLRRRFYIDSGRYGDDDLERWAEICLRVRPSVIYGLTSALYDFARFLQWKGIRFKGVKGIFTTAERLYPFQREAIARAFSCNVFDQYGCVEVLHLGCECRKGNMHRVNDFSIIETERNPETGLDAFIVTSLWNYAFPLLRYRNNDEGKLLDGTCSCGNNFGLLNLSISRIFDNFPIPTGEIIHGSSFVYMMYDSKGIDKYQFYQPERDRIVLYVVKGADFSQESVLLLNKVKSKIDGVTKGTVKFEVSYTPDIPLTRAGKYLYVRSDVRGR